MSGYTVPCRVCGEPAPQYGKYAKQCEQHRGVEANGDLDLDELVEAARAVVVAKRELARAELDVAARLERLTELAR